MSNITRFISAENLLSPSEPFFASVIKKLSAFGYQWWIYFVVTGGLQLYITIK